MIYLPIHISKTDKYGEMTEGRQHIFRESTEGFTDVDLEEVHSGVSLCGKYGHVTDGSWPLSWDELMTYHRGDKIEPGCCKTCKRIYEKNKELQHGFTS